MQNKQENTEKRAKKTNFVQLLYIIGIQHSYSYNITLHYIHITLKGESARFLMSSICHIVLNSELKNTKNNLKFFLTDVWPFFDNVFLLPL